MQGHVRTDYTVFVAVPRNPAVAVPPEMPPEPAPLPQAGYFPAADLGAAEQQFRLYAADRAAKFRPSGFCFAGKSPEPLQPCDLLNRRPDAMKTVSERHRNALRTPLGKAARRLCDELCARGHAYTVAPFFYHGNMNPYRAELARRDGIQPVYLEYLSGLILVTSPNGWTITVRDINALAGVADEIIGKLPGDWPGHPERHGFAGVEMRSRRPY